MRSDPTTVLPLTPTAFQILLILADGRQHGYAVLKELAAAAPRAAYIGPTTVYRTIKRLVSDGLIVASDASSDDARRHYYSLTPWGQEVAQAEARRLTQLARYAHRALRSPSGDRWQVRRDEPTRQPHPAMQAPTHAVG